MGLDTTHNCWHGPYSSFQRFRKTLAAQIGIDLDEYSGYGDSYLNPADVQLKATKDLTTIEYDIYPLLNHSDCDGKLTIREARRVAKGLTNILENFNDKLPADYNFKEQIAQFRDGCLDAVNKKEQIHFH